MNTIERWLRAVVALAFLYSAGLVVYTTPWYITTCWFVALILGIAIADWRYSRSSKLQFSVDDVAVHFLLRALFAGFIIHGMSLSTAMPFDPVAISVIGWAMLAAVLFTVWRFARMTWESIGPAPVQKASDD
jgi:hypothetical protein